MQADEQADPKDRETNTRTDRQTPGRQVRMQADLPTGDGVHA